MNSRSKKYYESRKADSGDKKGSSTKVGYNAQNEKTIKQTNKNPSPSKTKDKPHANDSTAEQDDTAGLNNSGERSDDN